MKNPAKPGVSSTNGTRGVVLSGMTKNAALTVCALACWVGVLVCITVGPVRAGDESGAWFGACCWLILSLGALIAEIFHPIKGSQR